eukprot:SAG31_NODE_3736_length_3944_cov_1.151120_2_plen_71_part_00
MNGGSRSRQKTRLAEGDVLPKRLRTVEFTPGESFTLILRELTNCGYVVSWRVIDAREWLAQVRTKAYLAQ